MSVAGFADGLIQSVQANGREIALLIRAEYQPAATKFLTPDYYKQQVGFVVYPAGSTIPVHTHRDTERRLAGMSELLIVRQGRCLVDLYDDPESLVTTIEIKKGDVLLLVAGGHGIRMLEATVILEVKQGPFAGPNDKVLLHKTQ